MSRRIAPADAAVLAAAVARDVEVTARQLERWRQVGAIPKPRRTSLLRQRFSESAYTTDEINYIVEFARRSRRRRESYRVVLWVFLDEHHVPDVCLRWAFGELVEAKRAALRSDEEGQDRPTLFVEEAGLDIDLEAIERAGQHAPYPALYLGLLLMREPGVTGAPPPKLEQFPSVDDLLKPLVVMLAHKQRAAARQHRGDLSYDEFVALAFRPPPKGPTVEDNTPRPPATTHPLP